MKGLFGGPHVSQVRQGQLQAMRSEVEHYNGDRLLNTNQNDFVEYLTTKYSIKCPKIIESGLSIDQKEVSHVGVNMWGDRTPIRSVEYILYVPFDGEKELLSVAPSTHQVYTEPITISEGEISVVFRPHNNEVAYIKQQMDKFVAALKRDVEQLSRGFDGFDAELRATATQKVEERRAAVLAERWTVAALGFPLRQRSDAAKTYIAPLVQRKIDMRPPPAVQTAYVPEPTLDTKEYENILDIMYNMALVMERSPSRFIQAEEEELRDHFLVQLNGQYEGQATGETFNAGGKTDILIRHNGGNLFIAECKFWGGEKKLFETVDQLLSYTTWRDTKTSIVMFNKNKNFSGVLEAIRTQMPKHVAYKRTEPYKRNTAFRYVLTHPSDSNKELTTTVLVFDILSLAKADSQNVR